MDEDIDLDKVKDNYVEPDATVEYLFAEKADRQVTAMNDDQGYFFAFLNIFREGDSANDNLEAFTYLLDDFLNYSAQTQDFLP